MKNIVKLCDSFQHCANGSGVNHALAALNKAFVIFAKAAIAIKPRKSAFNDPSSSQKLEAFNAWVSGYDLKGDIQVATSTAHRRRIEREATKLEKQHVELLAFDEKLRHYADRRITLDLDDGVKVNYGKFGDLLAEVKAVHGKIPEEK